MRFYDAAGTELTSATTARDGRFAAPLPTSARKFTVNINGQVYYVSFGYNSREYIPASRRAGRPPINEGQPTALATDVILTPRSETPPPAPDGCLADG